MMHLTVLTPEDIESIHQATLHILSETGIILAHPQACQLLLDAGASVAAIADPGRGEARIQIPPDLVERALALCPRQVCLRGRGGMVKVLGDGSLHWHNLGGARDVYEPRRNQRRPAMLQDVRNSARLLDALEGPTTLTPFFTPQDVAGPLMSLAMYRHSLPYTTKPLQGPGVQNGLEAGFALRMAEVIGPPAEVISLSVSPVSPLIFSDDAVEAIMAIAAAGVPFGPLPCPTAGATAPFSIAGALAQQNAEVIASLVLAQLIHPGLPVIYCGRLAMMEPRTGLSVWGGVELGLASAGTVQVAHRYGLPVNVYGLSTNAHTLDLQNGYERALNAAIPALAGADELSGIGEMEAGVMGSYAQMVCDSEIAASVRRLRRGFAVDADALAVDVIAAVMNAPAGGRNFLGQKHTSRHLRAGEVLITRLAERRSWETWEREGHEGMAERAQAEAERILAQHEVPPLAPEQGKELDAIMAQAAYSLVK
jgi:trimethylamine--corrinoid protein Co-methyltransferase